MAFKLSILHSPLKRVFRASECPCQIARCEQLEGLVIIILKFWKRKTWIFLPSVPNLIPYECLKCSKSVRETSSFSCFRLSFMFWQWFSFRFSLYHRQFENWQAKEFCISLQNKDNNRNVLPGSTVRLYSLAIPRYSSYFARLHFLYLVWSSQNYV